jgi:hypothetical protein
MAMSSGRNGFIPFEVTDDGRLLIRGDAIVLPHPVKEAVGINDWVVVLYDPDSNPRRWGTFPNLAAVDRDGHVLWVAETPTTDTGDCYVAIRSADPLVVHSWSTYKCEIDPGSGQIVSRVFTK